MGGGDDGPGERVLRLGLHCGSQREQAVHVAVDGMDTGDPVACLGQRPGLVEQHQVDDPDLLESESVLDQDPVAGGEPGGDGDHQWDGEPQSVRAGDNQNRHRPHHRLVWTSGEQPGGSGHRGNSEGQVEEERRRPVGERLGAGPGPLSLGHQPLDPGQCRSLPDLLDLDPDRGVGGDGPGDHAVPGSLGHRF